MSGPQARAETRWAYLCALAYKYSRREPRRCGRTANHGAYCYRHAKALTGFHAPDRNRHPEPGGCVEIVEATPCN